MTWLLGPVLFFMTVAMAGEEAGAAEQAGSTNAPALELELAGPVEPKFVYWSMVKARKRVPPAYPEVALQKNEEGDCSVMITINLAGVPVSALPDRCPEDFRQNATAAALASRFEPYLLDGEPASVRFAYNYRFLLGNSAPAHTPRASKPPSFEDTIVALAADLPGALPTFVAFDRVGFIAPGTTRRQVIAKLGRPDRTKAWNTEMYWGCEDQICFRFAVEVDMLDHGAWRVWLGPHLDADMRTRVFGDGEDLAARVLGLTEEELTAWIGAPPVGRAEWHGGEKLAEAYRTGTQANWEWKVKKRSISMNVHFGADGNALDARWQLPLGLESAREKHRVNPKYPAEARLNQEEADCSVKVKVDVHGVPVEVIEGDCPENFRASAEAAAMASRFYPYRENGRPVPFQFTYKYKFRLR